MKYDRHMMKYDQQCWQHVIKYDQHMMKSDRNMHRNMGEGATNDEAHGVKNLDGECKRILSLTYQHHISGYGDISV